MIQIVEVSSKKQLKEFVNYPNVLYKNNPFYTPSIESDELSVFDEKKHPVYKHAWSKQFLAQKKGKTVGRIAVLMNENEVKLQNKSKLRFGWLDFEEDIEIAKKLLEKAEEIAQKENLQMLEGPMGFTNLDKSGMLTMGFEEQASMIGIYNAPYYPKFLEKLGYAKEKTYVEYLIDAPTEIDKIHRFRNIVEQKFKLKSVYFKNKKELAPYVDKLFDLVQNSYQQLPTFVPLENEELEYYKEKYLKILNLDFINCVVDEQDDLVGFSIISPSYVEALKKTKGKLFPFGWIHFLKAMKKSPHAEFILIGVLPEFQKKGVTALLFSDVFNLIQKLDIKTFETNPQLEDNKAVQVLWKPYNPKLFKRRATFSKKI